MLLVSICKILMQFSSSLWTGLHFIGSNFVSTSDERQYTPIGFDVIFPGMIEYAENMGLNLPLNPVSVDAMLHKRDLEFRRYRIYLFFFFSSTLPSLLYL